jgi:hypothetical protein
MSTRGGTVGQWRLASQSPLPDASAVWSLRGHPWASGFIFARRRMRMFWPFHRQKLRPTQRPAVRPCLEILEGRALPSVAVLPPTDPSSGGAALSQHSSAHGNPNGAAGEIPAFFNGQSVTINVNQLPDNAAASIIAHNKNLNIIYVTNDLDDKQDFSPVINAVPGQNFNALWLQIKISFNPGVTPHQFTSEADVLAAAKAGQITLTNTGEVYRDSVVGGHSG